MPVVFRLSGRPGVFWRVWLSVVLVMCWQSVRPLVWGVDVPGVQTLVWLPVQRWFLGCGRA
eukprot:scaffold7825_cov128-Isochrysis_galbana.AAC.5